MVKMKKDLRTSYGRPKVRLKHGVIPGDPDIVEMFDVGRDFEWEGKGKRRVSCMGWWWEKWREEGWWAWMETHSI